DPVTGGDGDQLAGLGALGVVVGGAERDVGRGGTRAGGVGGVAGEPGAVHERVRGPVAPVAAFADGTGFVVAGALAGRRTVAERDDGGGSRGSGAGHGGGAGSGCGGRGRRDQHDEQGGSQREY